MRCGLVKLKTFFFQPRELRGEFTDFSVQVGELLLIVSFRGIKGFVLVNEQVGQSFESRRLPLMELGRVNIILGGDLSNSKFLFEQLTNDLSFEGG